MDQFCETELVDEHHLRHAHDQRESHGRQAHRWSSVTTSTDVAMASQPHRNAHMRVVELALGVTSNVLGGVIVYYVLRLLG